MRKIRSAYENETVIVMDYEPYWNYYSPDLSDRQMESGDCNELQDIDSWDVNYQSKMIDMIVLSNLVKMGFLRNVFYFRV